MKRGSIIFLQGVIIAIGLVALAVCAFLLPRLLGAETRGDFDYGYIFIGMYVAAIPFYYALYMAYRLLNYIDKDKAFSRESIAAFKAIKYCGALIGVLFTAGLPYIFYLADKDDAPGVLALAIVIAGASYVIATFAAILQRLLQSAVDMKTENDLTV